MGKKTKGCTLERQERWFKKHRDSLEPGEIYEPFWRTDDIPSSGIKTKIPHFRDPKRLVHVLSQNELWMYMHLANNPFVIDVYEQYAIPLEATLQINDSLRKEYEEKGLKGREHPKYPNTRVPMIQTIDFLVTMLDPITGDVFEKAFPVKPLKESEDEGTKYKLKLQEKYCEQQNIAYELITCDYLRTVHSQNLDTLYRHRSLSVFLESVAKRWLPNFFGVLSDDRHARTALLVEKASIATGVNYETGVLIFYNALWHKKVLFNKSKYLRLEMAASDLGIQPNAA